MSKASVFKWTVHWFEKDQFTGLPYEWIRSARDLSDAESFANQKLLEGHKSAWIERDGKHYEIKAA